MRINRAVTSYEYIKFSAGQIVGKYFITWSHSANANLRHWVTLCEKKIIFPNLAYIVRMHFTKSHCANSKFITLVTLCENILDICSKGSHCAKKFRNRGSEPLMVTGRKNI